MVAYGYEGPFWWSALHSLIQNVKVMALEVIGPFCVEEKAK